MNKEIKNYLTAKPKSEYTFLDNLFEMYLDGEIKKLLSSYDDVEIYAQFLKTKTIQLNYSFHNIHVIVDFFEDNYNVVIYKSGTNIDDFEKLFTEHAYGKDFSLGLFIKEIDIKIKQHPELKDTALIKKKAKIYSIITWGCLCLPIVIFGILGLYCVITGAEMKGNIWWAIFLIAVPLIIGLIFDFKSERMK